MDRLEGEFLKLQEFNLLVWHNYIDDLFFIWFKGKEKIESFLDDLKYISIILISFNIYTWVY